MEYRRFMSCPIVTIAVPGLESSGWVIHPGQCWAVLGPAGAGKGDLLACLAGTARSPAQVRYHAPSGGAATSYPDPSTVSRWQIVRVRFADQRGLLGSVPYHQARWNSCGGEDAITVTESLSAERIYRVSPYQVVGPEIVPRDFAARRETVVAELGIEPLLGRRVLALSNGERRKVMFARALIQQPRLLLLEDPFAGLDCGFRERLHGILAARTGAGMAVVFSTPRADDLGCLPTHFATMRDGTVTALDEWDGGVPQNQVSAPLSAFSAPSASGEALVELRQVRIQYGDKVVLHDLDWTIRRGESWAVLGANGAGKTTLVGLLLGDNPQAYAQDVRLFGMRFGKGISARELRQRVGHVSPELHLNFPTEATTLATVASGLFDSLGLYRQPDESQWRQAEQWLQELGLASVATCRFGQLSEGQQRLALLARGMVKAPDLLVLDEPCQGLDTANRAAVHAALARLVQANHTQVVYITHHPEDLPPCIGHVLELADGMIRRP
jgi:molybdate transport system ATP-binding protein